MSTAEPSLGAGRTSDWYASRARRASIAAGALVSAVAGAYSVAIVQTRGEPLLLVPLVGVVVVLALFAHPVVGVYLLFGAAILLEQFYVLGLAPITVGTHFYQNLSAYTPVPLRLSVADLLVLLTLVAWAARAAAGQYPKPRLGPFGLPVAGYGLVFVIGTVIGAGRGGWDIDAALAELRGPVQLCLTYFLAVNLIRDRAAVRFLVWEFVLLVGVKAVQGILNYQAAAALPYDLPTVTGHEDVVFFNLAIALAAAALVLGVRSKLGYAVLALLPVIVMTEMLTERRVGFVALGVALLIVAILSSAAAPRRGLVFALVGASMAIAYGVVFWEASGPLAEPIRAVRSVLDPSSLSARDDMSNEWRVIENRNIAYTIEQLPLTGVGLGQEYLVRQEPPALPPAFTYWRYTTHNALLWLWLKAGPVGALALWFLVARVVVLGSAWVARLRDPEVRWFAVLPVCLIALQVVFSAVELGLTYSRTMIVLGTVLGIGAALADDPVARSGARTTKAM